MEENKNSGVVEPFKSTENLVENNTSENESEAKSMTAQAWDSKMSERKKPREIFFGGERMTADKDLKSKVQDNLYKALPGAFVVEDVKIEEDEVIIKINRHAKKFYQPQAGCITLDDAVVLSGHLQKGDKRIPLPMHPFADQMNYHFGLDNIKDGYNHVVGKGNKIKDLVVTTDPFSVTYNYKF